MSFCPCYWQAAVITPAMKSLFFARCLDISSVKQVLTGYFQRYCYLIGTWTMYHYTVRCGSTVFSS